MDRSSGCRVSVEVQAQAFRLQVKLAMKLNLPLVLHIREAEDLGLSILKEVGLPADWPIHRYVNLSFISPNSVSFLKEEYQSQA